MHATSGAEPTKSEVEFPRERFARAIEDGGDETADRLRRQVDQLLNNGELAP